MKYLGIVMLSIVIPFTLTSCEENGIFNCTKGDGNVQVEERFVTSFEKVELRGSMDLILTQGSEPSISIEADQNILEVIETRVSSGRLIIDTDGCIRNHHPIKVWITNPTFKGASIVGSGDITATNIIVQESMDLNIDGSGDIEMDVRSEDINTDIEGSGDVRLYGTATLHDIDIDGSGDVLAIDLNSDDVRINIAGSGDVWVEVNESLDVVISGSGNVHYKGQPTINSNIEGSGRIINEN